MREGKLVLVLYASPTTRAFLRVILRREGYRVVSFADPVEALLYLAQHRSRPPGLLLIGMRLPRVDGYRVLQYLKGEPGLQDIPAIALLASTDGVLGHLKARLAGAWQTLSQPLQRERVLALVAERIVPPRPDGP